MRLVAVVTIVWMAVFCAAEGAEAASIAFGGKGGVSLTSIYGDDIGDFEPITAPAGGIFVTWYFSRYIGAQVELLYAQKGIDVNLPEVDDYWYDEEDGRRTIDYIEIPVLLKFRIPVGNTFSPNVFAGVAFAKRIGHDGLAYYDGEVRDFDCLTRDDAGLAFGIGLDRLWPPIAMTVDIRYEIGLWNTKDDDCWYTQYGTDAPTEKNTSASIMVGFGFAM